MALGTLWAHTLGQVNRREGILWGADWGEALVWQSDYTGLALDSLCTSEPQCPLLQSPCRCSGSKLRAAVNVLATGIWNTLLHPFVHCFSVSQDEARTLDQAPGSLPACLPL